MLSSEFMLIGAMVSIAVAVYSLVTMFLSNSSGKEKLAWAAGDEPAKSKSPLINLSRPLVHQLTLKYVAALERWPVVKSFNWAAYKANVHQSLRRSGLTHEINVEEFIGLQILWSVFVPALLALLNILLDLQWPGLVIVGASIFGALFPRMYVQSERKKRETSIRMDLPFFADLLALATKAGSDLVGAIRKIVEKSGNTPLADEFATVLKDISLGSTRADALKKMADRIDMQEITSFVAVIVDAEANGASVYQVLKDQSAQIRMDRLTRAEKAGARASQMMLLPMMMFILPAIFIVVLGPIALRFLGGGN